MATYTYDDFLKAAQAQGWGQGSGFSDADWDLAQKNADAGMSILNAKKDYLSASTEEEKQRANQMAEQIRSQYGHYTGGTTGGQYYLDRPSPGSFEMKGEKPSFSYDLENDPVYQAYQKQYAREGQRAAQDTLGNMAAMTGGIPSSYAATAASQAGDYYASQMADKVPELYQQAYSKYLSELNQYNTDRNFQYGQHVDEINSQTAGRQEALQNASQNAQLAMSVGDNSLLQKYFGIHPDPYLMNLEALYNYGAYRDARGDSTLMDKLAAYLDRYLG